MKKITALVLALLLCFGNGEILFAVRGAVGENSWSDSNASHALNNIKDNPVSWIEADNSRGMGEIEIDRAQNETPIVNINRPSAGGVSVNYFKDFNVNDENLIINNHKGQTAQTNLAGVIYSNPNFNKPGGTEADIILTEVTSVNRTNIEGYVEIAGKEADLIVANPNGINVSGAGFINTARLTLIAGASGMGDLDRTLNEAGGLNPFVLSKNADTAITVVGMNVVDKAGKPVAYNLVIDAKNIDYAQLIGKVVKINGDIIGSTSSEIEIISGNEKAVYNQATRRFEVTSSNGDVNEVKPEFAIDSTAFGGIYAGRIKVIATQDGVGVRMRKDLISDVDDIVFDARGNIVLDNMIVQANRSVDIKVKDKFENTGTIISGSGKIKVEAWGDIINKGKLYSQNSINFRASGLFANKEGAQIVSKNIAVKTSGQINNAGQIYANEVLEVFAEKEVSSSGKLHANKRLSIVSNRDITNSGVVSSEDITVSASSGAISNSGEINAAQSLMLTSREDITNTGDISSNNLQVQSSTGSIKNQGNIYARGKMTLTPVKGLFNYVAGKIGADGGMEIETQETITNEGKLYAQKTLKINAAQTIENKSGAQIEADEINANTNEKIINYGHIYMMGSGKSLLKSVNEFINNANIYSRGSFSIESLKFTNAQNALIDADILSIETAGDIYNNDNAKLYARDELTLKSGGKTQNGLHTIISASASGNIHIVSTGVVNNWGEIIAGGQIDIKSLREIFSGGGVGSKAVISGGGLTQLQSGERIINYGYIQSVKGNLKLESSSPINVDYTLNGNREDPGRKLSWVENCLYQIRTDNKDAASLIRTGIHNYGSLYSGADMELNSKSVLHNNIYDSLIYSVGSINFNVKEILYNRGALIGRGIYAQNDINMSDDSNSRISRLINYDGYIEAGKNIRIMANEVINYGSDNVDIFVDPYAAVDSRICYNDNTDSAKGKIGKIIPAETEYTSKLTSQESQIKAKSGRADINAQSLIVNYNSIIYGGAGLNLTATAGAIINSVGEFEVKNINDNDAVVLKSNNAKSRLMSGTTVSIVTNRLYNSSIRDTDGAMSQEKKRTVSQESQEWTGIQSNTPSYGGKAVDAQTGGKTKNLQLPRGSYGKYKPSTNPAHLYETDVLLRDDTTFFGSQYFLNRIGLDPFSVEYKFLGDSYMEHNMLSRSLQEQGFLENLHHTPEDIDVFIEKAYQSLDAHKVNAMGLEFGKELTEEQINALSEDIVWYVLKQIELPNGETVQTLVPQIYLCQNTVNKLKMPQRIFEEAQERLSQEQAQDIAAARAKAQANEVVQRQMEQITKEAQEEAKGKVWQDVNNFISNNCENYNIMVEKAYKKIEGSYNSIGESFAKNIPVFSRKSRQELMEEAKKQVNDALLGQMAQGTLEAYIEEIVKSKKGAITQATYKNVYEKFYQEELAKARQRNVVGINTTSLISGKDVVIKSLDGKGGVVNNGGLIDASRSVVLTAEKINNATSRYVGAKQAAISGGVIYLNASELGVINNDSAMMLTRNKGSAIQIEAGEFNNTTSSQKDEYSEGNSKYIKTLINPTGNVTSAGDLCINTSGNINLTGSSLSGVGSIHSIRR
jgi:filamentous hemagglutinin family protein